VVEVTISVKVEGKSVGSRLRRVAYRHWLCFRIHTFFLLPTVVQCASFFEYRATERKCCKCIFICDIHLCYDYTMYRICIN